METEALVAEVRELRKQLQRTRAQLLPPAILGVFAGIAALGLLVSHGGQSHSPEQVAPGTVRAQRFEVVDEKGQYCGYFAAFHGTPQLVMLRTPMEAGLTLDVQGDQPTVRLDSARGFAMLTVPAVDEKEELFGPQLVLQDKSGVSLAAGATAHGPFLRFHEASGKWTHAQRGDLP